MNKIKQAMDVIDVITNVMDEAHEEPIKSDREAIDRINGIIRVVNKHGFHSLGWQLDEIRQWLGRNE